MDTKKKHRKVLRTAFTKLSMELDGLLGASDTQSRSLKVSLNILRRKADELQRIDGEIYDILIQEDASEQDLLLEMEGADTYFKKFEDLNSRCEEWTQASQAQQAEADIASSTANLDPDSVSSVSNIACRRKFKLPVLEFKKFDGTLKDWLPFWSQFQKIHVDADIDLNDKVEYLFQATSPGSRARQLVESFPATGDNYKKMIDCLCARFGREDLQIEVYVRELLKLVINNTSSGNKIDLSLLYDKLETQLRALGTLGIQSEKYAAILFPLVESCLPSDLLRIWQRCPRSFDDGSSETSNSNVAGVALIENRLQSLMNFLKNEVDNEQHIVLAGEGFDISNGPRTFNRPRGDKSRMPEAGKAYNPSTAMGLMNTNDLRRCVFCQNVHDSTSCFKAQSMTYNQRKDILAGKGACYRCLKIGHQSSRCRGKLKCLICGRNHAALMCSNQAGAQKKEDKPLDKTDHANDHVPEINQTLSNSTNTHVFLQTLRVTMENAGISRSVRAVIDTGSQKTYIQAATAKLLAYDSKREVNIVHGLFGGTELLQKHRCYDVKLRHNNYSCTFEAMDQSTICGEVSSVFDGPWSKELRDLKIEITDSHGPAPIELLIGADIAGRLYTGRRHVLKCGLVALETLLGWTLMGKLPLKEPKTQSMCSLSLLVNHTTISNLWELDVLGISDPAQKKSRDEMATAAKELFLETISINKEGRYEVRLPWLEGHPALPSNYTLAKSRLDSAVKKMIKQGYLEAYDQVFQEWLKEGIIEEIFEDQPSINAHYLPHRPVIKLNSASTKIRPVFDASAKNRESPSLNQCLEKGPNLIELIPVILLRFRQQKIGLISDIRKAFLQISIHEADRDFLRFLWMSTGGEEKIYRHRRVVFGLSCSPFLLGASLDYHLAQIKGKCSSGIVHSTDQTVSKLAESFYVDNCVTSVANEEELRLFIEEASITMAEGKFDLRGWEFTDQVQEVPSDTSTFVLGMAWNKQDDTICINLDYEHIEELLSKPVTKRVMLSFAQRVFDPIGYTCPTTLMPKLLLQEAWKKELTWDTPVDAEMESRFRSWLEDLHYLSAIKIPRWIRAGPNEAEEWSLHTFCDASKKAFSAVVFLRGVQGGRVLIHLLAAKSRVAPLKTLSIPRLELMAAVIGVRLYNTIKRTLKIESKSYFWSDSTTVLAWIRRAEEWSTFVWNRITEIRKTTTDQDWHHVPGVKNPADFPSRGCSAKGLLESQWWEGPSWLYGDASSWPGDDLDCDEDEINIERKKKLVKSLVNNEQQIMTSEDWHLGYFSQYTKTLRMCAWILRFAYNIRNEDTRLEGKLTAEEINKAELFVLQLVQRECFVNGDKRLSGFDVFKGEDELIRVKTRISSREDTANFRFPIVLPSQHFLVNRLIFGQHVKSCHVGVQGLMSVLRENYWVLGGRRALKSAIVGCVVCKRFNSKPITTNSPPLPLDRVRDATAFEVTGVDFAGPLFLRTGDKVWICIFTCAVYRAVHFEVCSGLSVDSFIQALRRFIARRGRPKTIYSDNGTNFVGTDNAFSRVDFQKISEHSAVERIRWCFNPPTAAWWGGFWERFVGVLKQLLRRVLGRASLNREQLETVICDCESVINMRPLTYPSSDANDLAPLTPMMFLRDRATDGVPDCDVIDRDSLCRRMVYRQKLLEHLRGRFRSEYLGQLKLWSKGANNYQIKVGEIVFVGNDQDKRTSWPLGRVMQIFPGKDGRIRLVRVRTEKGQFLRPVQRLYPLECTAATQHPEAEEMGDCGTSTSASSRRPRVEASVPDVDKECAETGVDDSKVPAVSNESVTRSGRAVKVPSRYSD